MYKDWPSTHRRKSTEDRSTPSFFFLVVCGGVAMADFCRPSTTTAAGCVFVFFFFFFFSWAIAVVVAFPWEGRGAAAAGVVVLKKVPPLDGRTPPVIAIWCTFSRSLAK